MSFGKIDSYGIDPSEKYNVLPPIIAMGRTSTSSDAELNKKVVYRCRVFNIAISDERDEFEDLCTKFANGDPNYTWHGERDNFSKDGEYLVALRWYEVIQK